MQVKAQQLGYNATEVTVERHPHRADESVIYSSPLEANGAITSAMPVFVTTEAQETTKEENLAIKIVGACSNVILKSATRSDSNDLSFNERLELRSFIRTLFHPRAVNFTDLEQWIIDVQWAHKYSVGNCNQCASLVLYYAMKLDPSIEVEAMMLINKSGRYQGHKFNVIGRKEGSKLNDYRTWGENSYVVDVWAKEYYPTRDIPSRLKGWSRDKNGINHTLRFDLEKHFFRKGLSTKVLPEFEVDFTQRAVLWGRESGAY